MKSKAAPLVVGRVRLPRADDVKLIFMQLAWPPSCYVSDATDGQGRRGSGLPAPALHS